MANKGDKYKGAYSVTAILKAFYKGRENMITAQELAERMGIKSREQVRKYISDARKLGEPICSVHDGFFYATKPEDIDLTLKHFDDRIQDMLDTMEALRKAQRRL